MSNDAFEGFEDLLEGGAISQSLPGYTERSTQIEMAAQVAEALTEGTHAAIEAPTGTGKSLAYLLPSVRSGKRVVVSTANKALQSQIFDKDIPFIQQHVQQFDAVMVKGMSNYLCLDRFAKAESELLPEQESEQVALKAFTEGMNALGETWDGDLESKIAPAATDTLRDSIRVDRDRCASEKCAFYSDCYFYRMKERARHAKVVVTNHTLLLLDLQMGGKVLPEHDVTIVDEAHHLEDEATEVATVSVSDSAMQRFLSLKELRVILPDKMEKALMSQFEATWSILSQKAQAKPGKRVVLSESIEEGLQLASLVGSVATHLKESSPSETTERGQALHDKLIKRTENLSEDLRTVFSVKDTTQYVYYLEVSQRGRNKVTIEAKAAPLDVSRYLRTRLFGHQDKLQVICTSATIAAGTLDYFKGRVGLDQLRSTKEAVLPAVFDYPTHALLYLPRRIPEPAGYGCSPEEKRDYQQAIASEMLKLARASRGRAFLLFTSKDALNAAYLEIAADLRKDGHTVLKQGDMPTAVLTQQFREAESAVLFGLKSYWEGVDIAGDQLSLVVIDKLPFAPPDDPVYSARSKLLEAAGEKPFFTYSVPQAIIQLKQGLGRLIRTHEDRGVMAILDSRLHSKGYGKQILGALPEARVTNSLLDVQQFFS